jgi:hypothetical protein
VDTARLILQYIKALIWPVTVLILSIFFRTEVRNIFRRLRKADLPGGISIETFPDHIREAKELSVEVSEEKHPSIEKKEYPTIPLTEANARMLNLGLNPSPTGLELSHYRILSEQDPNLALAGLRIEVETMLKNLAKGFKVPIGERDSTGIIARKLREKGAITSRQAELIKAIVQLCNAAVHGIRVTSSQAEEILDIGEILRDNYISWLSWGFRDK